MLLTRKAIILLIFVLFEESDGYCPTAKEGETVTFIGTFTHTLKDPVEIIWSKELILSEERIDYTYSRCDRLSECLDSEDKTQTSLVLKGNNVYEFSFQIKNVTKDDFGLWKLMYSGVLVLEHGEPLYTCNLEPTINITSQTERNEFYFLIISSSMSKTLPLVQSKQADPNENHWFCIEAGLVGAILVVTLVIVIMMLIGGVYCYNWRKGKEKADDKLPLIS
ncbi:uncharacterized protein LOC106064609 isoform X2 [Biomphalaria glabrata]|uniref:Uncharacterized protein LOC106064609 isoform X2 n=1 Tax=Biomphalaria glabrata TaxID=6526 RepID=A0A9W2YW32_BIOGL|nr:uncharacterized protein LOC106064609 isoform X2 [Biomphalaria glabrata]